MSLKQKITQKAKTIHEKVTEALTTIENLRYERAHGNLDQSFPILTMELHNLILEIEKDADDLCDAVREKVSQGSPQNTEGKVEP